MQESFPKIPNLNDLCCLVLNELRCSFPYIPVVPVPCHAPGCTCHYSQQDTANVFTCASLTALPGSLPVDTTWFVVQNSSNISLQFEKIHFTHSLRLLNLSGNSISHVSDEFVDFLNTHPNIKTLDLSHNNLSSINPTVTKLTSMDTILISNNPFGCNCEIQPIIKWLNGPDGHVVLDRENLLCHGGKYKGRRILNEVDLDCSSRTLEIALGVTVALALTMLLVTVVIAKKEEVLFLLYHYTRLSVLLRDDKGENWPEVQYDAFLCCRYGTLT